MAKPAVTTNKCQPLSGSIESDLTRGYCDDTSALFDTNSEPQKLVGDGIGIEVEADFDSGTFERCILEYGI